MADSNLAKAGSLLLVSSGEDYEVHGLFVALKSFDVLQSWLDFKAGEHNVTPRDFFLHLQANGLASEVKCGELYLGGYQFDSPCFVPVCDSVDVVTGTSSKQ